MLGRAEAVEPSLHRSHAISLLQGLGSHVLDLSPFERDIIDATTEAPVLGLLALIETAAQRLPSLREFFLALLPD